MKKLNKKYICIFMVLFTVVFTVGILCVYNAKRISFNRLTDEELKTVNHFDLFSYKTLTKELLEEKGFAIDEEQTGEIPKSTAYTYHSLSDTGVDDFGIEHCTVFISDKGQIKFCNLYYSFADIHDEKLEPLVNVYCKAADKKSFTANYNLPQKNKKVSFKQIVDLPLPESDERGQNDSSIQHYSCVRYDLFKNKGNDSMTMMIYVYDTGKVELFVSFSV